jgi:hypothetical protein
MRGLPKKRRGRVSTTRSAAVTAAGVLLLTALLAPTTMAAPPNPSPGSATVDGDISDWSLAGDLFADMTDGGNPDVPARAKLYLRYDCDTETLFALVLALGDEKARQDRPDEAYLQIDGSKLIDPDGDFAWVNGDGTLADGWEGAGDLAPGSYTLRAHVLIADDSADGYTPMDPVGRYIPLVIECKEDTPPPNPTSTPTGGVQPTQGTNPPDPTGNVAPTQGTGGQTTLPPTDTLDQTTPTGGTGGLALVLLMLGLSSAASLVATFTRRRRAVAVTVEESDQSR